MVAIYILLALGSFHPGDPGWSQSNYQGEIENVTGAVGAWLADVLFYFFGYTAYLIPIIIAGTGWLIFRRAHRLLEVDYFSVGLRLIGFLLMVLSLAALASMNAGDIYEFSAGGVAGDVIAQAMLPYFNQLGTTLLLLCFVGAGFTLLTGISWLTIVELTGLATIWCFRKLKQLPARLSGPKETEDTRGFMSVVDKFRRERDEVEPEEVLEEDDDEEVIEAPVKKPGLLSRFRKKDKQVQESEAAIADDKVDIEPKRQGRVEPVLSAGVAGSATAKAAGISSDNAEDTPPWQDEAEGSETIDFDKRVSTGAISHKERQLKAQKARVENGIIILPGEEGAAKESKQPMDPLPSISLLDVPNRKKNPISEEELDQVARLVESKLADFNITAQVVGVYPGPVITRFELDLALGSRLQKSLTYPKIWRVRCWLKACGWLRLFRVRPMWGWNCPTSSAKPYSCVMCSIVRRSRTVNPISPWCWDKTLQAIRSWWIWPRCRTFWWQVPQARVSRLGST